MIFLKRIQTLVLFFVVGVVASQPTTAAGQAVTGVGTDATGLPKGAMRFRLAGVWDGYDREFLRGESTPLLSRLSTTSLGVKAMPQLTGAELAMRTLSGNSAFQLSLGTLEASGDARSATTPFALDIGITNKLSVGVVVPYVETRNNALLVLNRSGTSATVGRNPAYSATTGASARNANGALLRQLAAARAQLTSEITRCALPTAMNCDVVRANVPAAQALLTQAAEFQAAVRVVYGDSVRGGAPVVPINGSAMQTAILARLATIRAAFTGFGVATLLEGTVPLSASIVNGPSSLASIVNDSAYQLDYTTLGGTRRAGIGDIDISASYLWYNSLGERPAQWLTNSRFGVRSQLAVGWRFGTAGADRTEDAFDVPIGSGANAMLARSTTDVVFNRLFWVSGSLRVVQPFSDNVMMRRPRFVDTALFAPAITAAAQRTLGRRIELEVVPRISIGRFIGLSGGYVMRRASADQFIFGATDSVSGATLSTSARTSQAYMVGATFSTMASYIRGRAKWPVEVIYAHTAPLSGSGNAVAAVATDRLELRIYSGYPRR